MQRQLDINTLIKFFCEALRSLLDTDYFVNTEGSFEISTENDSTIDICALESTIQIIEAIGLNSTNIDCISDIFLIDLLLKVPKTIKVLLFN